MNSLNEIERFEMKLTEKNYVERDISWMTFNHRVLEQAQREDVPLLERLCFLGIYSNNLDEFFRVRVATLNRIVEYTDKANKNLHERSEKTLKAIGKLNNKYSKEFAETVREVTSALHQEHIHLLNEMELNDEQKQFVRKYCLQQLSGNISPVWLSAVKRLNASADDTIHLAIRLQKWSEDKKKPAKEYAIIELPVGRYGRFVQLPSVEVVDYDADGIEHKTLNHYIMYLDDVLRCALPYMFPGTDFNHFEAWSFKFNKDAEMEIETDIQGGMLQKIAKGVRSRKNGMPVRFIYDEQMPKEVVKRIMEKLSISSMDTILQSGRYQNHKDLMKFPDCGRTDLKYPKWPAVVKPEFNDTGIIDKVRERDRFIHVPYHSFDAYINLLREAAVNPEVKSIKTTLYRLAKDSKVIGSLIAAARNGKQVTVVIELLARFDEESNIDWSRKMAEAGINVITGVEGLKIHSKITLICCKGSDIACISSGNFHEGNARAYTDLMLMTARKPIVNDVARVFQFIEKPYLPVRFKELLVSPNDMKRQILALINLEIKNHNQGLPSGILAKLNHITDEDVVKKIYEAASSGVKVRLLVRGNCSLVSTLPELNGNLCINNIIDRYLEHSRILVFANGTDLDHPEIIEEDGSHRQFKVFIGSADWMPRNLDHRIEVYTPVYDNDIKREARLIVEYGMRDDKKLFRSQEALYEHYQL